MTYTYAVMEVSQATFNEIKGKLIEAGYRHALDNDDRLDMRGIGLQVRHGPEEAAEPADTDPLGR